jgi:hypothetical protein
VAVCEGERASDLGNRLGFLLDRWVIPQATCVGCLKIYCKMRSYF